MKSFTSFLFHFLIVINIFNEILNTEGKIGGTKLSTSVYYDSKGNRHVELVSKQKDKTPLADMLNPILESDQYRLVVDSIYTETTKLILRDIYETIIKKGIKRLFTSLKKKITLLKIRKHLRMWWKFILPKLQGNLKFSKSAENRLKKCFYKSGVEAYKKTVLDVRETMSEFFFMTLMEFKEKCIVGKFSENQLLIMNFKKLENNAQVLISNVKMKTPDKIEESITE